MKPGPVVITEDDTDDKDVLEGILKELGIPNKLVWFTNSEDAFHYLKTTTEIPFIIFSDVNLPGHNGMDFKRRIDEDDELRRKSIPFVFYSTVASQQVVNEAYTQMTVQGFFKKSDSYEETRKIIRTI